MSENKLGFPKKIMATLCHHCPLCKAARNNPESIVGKMLHHKFHADHCPFWKAEIAAYGPAASEQNPDKSGSSGK
jgi:hypothetical protein